MSRDNKASSAVSRRTRRRALQSAIMVVSGLVPMQMAAADVLYFATAANTSTGVGTLNGGLGTDGGYWFDSANWENSSGSVTPFTPAGAGPTTPGNIDADTSGAGTWQTLGAVFDPVHDPNNTSGTTSLSIGSFYTSSSSSGGGAGVVNGATTTVPEPNTMTINSGTIEATSAIIDGRDANGQMVQNGGAVVSDGTMAIGGFHAFGNANGQYVYNGGLLQAGISSVGNFSGDSSAGLRLGLGTNNLAGNGTSNFPAQAINLGSSLGTGTLIINNGSGAINLASLFVGYGTYGLGVVDFHYNNGGVKTVQLTGTASLGSGGQLALRNQALNPELGPLVESSAGTYTSGGIDSILELNLDQAPTLQPDGAPANLALFTYLNGIHGTSSTNNPAAFFSPTGTEYANGSEITATFGGTTYAWDIYYDGSATFAHTTTIGSDTYSPDSLIASISGTGGMAGNSVPGITGESSGAGAVVLIGLVTPEPASAALGLLGAAFMATRRRRNA